MLNAMLFRRVQKVYLADVMFKASTDKAVVATLDANLRRLGFTLTGELAEALTHVHIHDIERIFKAVVAEAKALKGVRQYRPMYPNFPTQVMDAEAGELYWNALMHYWSGGRLKPVYEKAPRAELDFSEDKYTRIGLIHPEDVDTLLVNLFTSKSAFSETDKADVKALPLGWFAATYNLASSTLDNRENKAFIGAEVLRRDLNIIHKMDTATDVLRLAVALSDGDVSLAEKTRFRSFKRPERRMLMHMLSVVKGDLTEDMLRHEAAWKRLGERLHPGEFKQYPQVVAAFSAIRENGAVKTFNAKVEKAIAAGDILVTVGLLSGRPGEFARRLDKVLRMADSAVERSVVLNRFQGVAPKVSPTVLIQTRNAFVNRDKAERVFFPKGSLARMQVIADERDKISATDRAAVVNIIDGALATIFGERSNLGGAYVDPALKGIAIPFGMRNSSKGLKTLGRGSRLPLDADTGVVRFFIWWKNSEIAGRSYSGHTDIDLSAICLDADFRNVFDITYYNLREQGAVHSGDITSAPNGASEFIDIDVERLREQGVRYVAMTLYSYSGQGFVDLPECFAGFMERKDLGSGEVYDPRTVTNKVDLAADSQSATPFIFDLETGEAIWVDLTMKVQGAYANAYNSREVTKTVAQAMVELTPPNLYDLFVAHATARGGLVSRDKANVVYALDGDVTPFDSEDILANYL